MQSDMKSDNVAIIAGSQQNLVEVFTKRRFFQKRTTVEKYLATAVVVLLILFIVFFVLYLIFQQYYYKLMDEAICTSSECIESSMMLLQTVNFSQNPCEDFYNFACGRFGEEHPIQISYSHNSWFLEKEIRLNRMVQQILEAAVEPSDIEAVKNTKLFYQSCINGTELNSLGLEPLFELLELVDLPRTIPTPEGAEQFNLGKTLALAQRHLSQDIMVTVSTMKNVNGNDTNKNVTLLRLEPGVVGLNVLRHWKPDTDIFSLTGFGAFEVPDDGEDQEVKDPLKKLSAKKVILATISFIMDVLTEVVRELDVTSEYNATEIKSTAFKIITFTTTLVKDYTNNTNETEEVEDQYMTFSTLQTLLDEESPTDKLSNKIDWKEYIITLFENVSRSYDFENDLVVVQNIEYFKFLSRTLAEAKPVSIQRHVWWKLIQEYAKYTTLSMRNAYSKYSQTLYGENVVTTRAESCTSLMRKGMNVALSYQMSKKENFSTATIKVRQMLKDIEYVFGSMVNSLPWMDSSTKSATLEKAQSVKDEIGYASWLLDSEKVEKFYEGLELKKSEFLKNIIRVNEWEVAKVLDVIGTNRSSTNDSIEWFSNPLQVNAFYSRWHNAITIPPGILQTPFYFRGLESLNYGAIGSILGHELTHGFDVDGKNYNKFGERSETLWPEEVTAEFENRAKCFVNQYEDFWLLKDKKRLNGTMTLAENIADNGGMRESYQAYKLYSMRHGKEPKLPGFENFTHEQLLFLSFANIWCEKSIPRSYVQEEDSHSPHRVRVLATLQNMKEFSEAYNCPPGSFMNPTTKCIIW